MQYKEGLLFDGRYLFKRFLGSGSFGEVWLAQDTATDIEVAVKIYISVDSQGLADFKKEFQLSFNLNHSNLLHANYLGVCCDDNKPYLVMPFCEEGSVMKLAGCMSEERLWHFVRDVASGLDYLHSQKPPIIHQDIKPDNILILKGDNYVISDFGISKQLKSTLRRSSNMNSASGAVAYMGPERFSKQFQSVKASDIWSLGVTMYELVYGDLPFCGLGGSMQKQGADIPDLPEEFSEEMKILYTSCLANETWNRPSARQIVEYVQEYMNGKKPAITWNYAGVIPETSSSGPSSSSIQSTVLSPSSSVSVTLPITSQYSSNVDKLSSDKKSNIAWWWFVIVAVIGIAVGIVTRYMLTSL